MSKNAKALAEFLNELLALDQAAVQALFTFRVACLEALASHPTVQVKDVSGNNMVGIIGILNGLLGDECLIVVSDAGSGRLLRFETR